jgi:hypothetical protein
MIVTIIQGLWKEGNKKKNYCEGVCGHVAFWNFKLHFEPLSLPPLNIGDVNISFWNGKENKEKVFELRRKIMNSIS